MTVKVFNIATNVKVIVIHECYLAIILHPKQLTSYLCLVHA